jgi:hypothetical protein
MKEITNIRVLMFFMTCMGLIFRVKSSLNKWFMHVINNCAFREKKTAFETESQDHVLRLFRLTTRTHCSLSGFLPQLMSPIATIYIHIYPKVKGDYSVVQFIIVHIY